MWRFALLLGGCALDWTERTVPLVVQMTGNGKGTVSSTSGIYCDGTSCSEDVPVGELVTLHASQNQVARFDGWTGGCEGTGDCKLSMNERTVVEAHFTDAREVAVLLAWGSGSVTWTHVSETFVCGEGSIDWSLCERWIPYNDEIELVATPSPGYAFLSWGGSCRSANSPRCTMSVRFGGTIPVSFVATQ